MYTSLTTKYRPRKFRQVVGQPDVAIIKAVLRDSEVLPPLFLFCGPSGVGKTTLARIIASLVNCPNEADGEPCGSCEQCEAVQSGSLTNVYEIDAASHGTSDRLRDLVTKCYLSSTGARVIILDEAQAISDQGWNVLLKVLEEPPPDCMFVLLTSEPKKVPSKIRTRALQFTLKPVSPGVLRKYLGNVVAHSKVENISPDDIDVIVDSSEGSVRDALMMIEQCSASTSSASDIFSVKDMSLVLMGKMVEKDYMGSLSTLEQWWDGVGDAKMLLSQLATAFEKVALCKNNVEFFAGTSRDTYKYLADSLTVDELVSSLTTLSEWYPQVYSKPQLVMLAAKLYKGINGSTVVETAPREAAPTTPKVDITERLGRL